MNCQQTTSNRARNKRIAEANRRQALAACDLIEAYINSPLGTLMVAALTRFVDANSSSYERTFKEVLADLPEGQQPSTMVISCARREFIRIMKWAHTLAQTNREGVFVL